MHNKFICSLRKYLFGKQLQYSIGLFLPALPPPDFTSGSVRSGLIRLFLCYYVSFLWHSPKYLAPIEADIPDLSTGLCYILVCLLVSQVFYRDKVQSGTNVKKSEKHCAPKQKNANIISLNSMSGLSTCQINTETVTKACNLISNS